MKKIFFTFCLLLIVNYIFGQSSTIATIQSQSTSRDSITEVDTSLVPSPQLAMSTTDYLVTAGDIYTLAFAVGTSPVSYTIPVDTTYRIRVANLAVLDVSGMTFLKLKKQVEEIVTKNYPLSGVQFVLMTPAVFNVTILGEVKETDVKQAWALTKLSSIIKTSFTSFSSNRNIEVTSINGKKKTYDLFKATRFGELSQDPYLRPGDVIKVGRITRKVTITGAVERPGTYELLENENLKKLVEYYGGGLSPYADKTQVTLSRTLTGTATSGEKKYLDSTVLDNDYDLTNLDTITIGSITELKPFVSIEGIITLESSSSNDTTQAEKSPNTVEKLKVSFLQGENYADFVRRNQTLFNSYSDLINSYIERNGTKIPLNLELILFDNAYISSLFVEPNDKLVIPFQQYLSKIFISGEVNHTFEVNAWPLKKLSEVLAPISENLTLYASTRNIEVISVDGISSEYDLFQASRFGDLDNNPYIRAGEKIIVKRMSRKVTITGAVERPGTYELLENENLKKLVEYYGGGLSFQADISRTELNRIVDSDALTGKKIYLSETDFNNDYTLSCYDSITIPSYNDLKPVAFIEGALYADQTTTPEASTRIAISFVPGENYATFIRRNKNMFSAVSDTENSYIIRGSEKIPINIDKILYDVTYVSEHILTNNDTLMIPFRQYFISVAGAVVQPGRYPFIPDRDWSYYIGLAGGFTTQNSNETIVIKTINGDKLKKSDPLTPETTITAPYNSFLYMFNQYAPIITTILSVIGSFISVYAIISQ